MLSSEPAFPFAFHQNGTLPLLAGKRKIKGSFQVLLGIVFVGLTAVKFMASISRWSDDVERKSSVLITREQGLAMASIEFLHKWLIAITMMGTDLLTLF